MIIKLSACCLLCLIALVSNVNASDVIIFQYSTNPVRHVEEGTTSYQLDNVAIERESLNNNLPTDSNALKALVKKRIQAVDENKIKNAFAGWFKAYDIGIEKLPAIVFDQEYVIYGVTDYRQAKRLYNDYSE